MARAELGVNIDYVGTLRQGRRTRYPDPIAAAGVAERAGASQIKAHSRRPPPHPRQRPHGFARHRSNNAEYANGGDSGKSEAGL